MATTALGWQLPVPLNSANEYNRPKAVINPETMWAASLKELMLKYIIHTACLGICVAAYPMPMALNAETLENGAFGYGTGSRYRTVVFEPRLLGLLHAEGREPFLVFSGLGCQGCDINRSIYIHSPSDPPMESGERGDRYVHPGKYYDNEKQSPYEVVRMFVGQCLPGRVEGVIWFSNTKLSSRKWETSTFVARVEREKLVAKFVYDRAITISATQAAVKRKSCIEVDGRRFFREP